MCFLRLLRSAHASPPRLVAPAVLVHRQGRACPGCHLLPCHTVFLSPQALSSWVSSLRSTRGESATFLFICDYVFLPYFVKKMLTGYKTLISRHFLLAHSSLCSVARLLPPFRWHRQLSVWLTGAKVSPFAFLWAALRCFPRRGFPRVHPACGPSRFWTCGLVFFISLKKHVALSLRLPFSLPGLFSLSKSPISKSHTPLSLCLIFTFILFSIFKNPSFCFGAEISIYLSLSHLTLTSLSFI